MREGFFDLVTAERNLEGIIKEEKLVNECRVLNCKSCSDRSTDLEIYGMGRKGILILGSQPSKIEVEQREFLSGSSGAYLKGIFEKFNDVSLLRDCYYSGWCRCQKLNIVVNTTEKICRNYWREFIKENNIKVIITMGESALRCLIGDRESVGVGFDKYCGYTIPDQTLGCWIIPNWGINDLRRDKENMVLFKRWRDILCNGLKYADIPFKTIDIKEELPLDADACIETLLSFMDSPRVAIDFETTGLKPYREGMRIVCMSIADEKRTSAMPIHYDNPKFLYILKRFLTNPDQKKILQNCKMEELWTRITLGYDIENVCFDTMIASHILDNRSGVTGLKFQAYVRFGISGYEEEVKSFLQAASGNDFNALATLPVGSHQYMKVLRYNAWDSRITFDLYDIQLPLIADDVLLRKGKNFFLEGQLALMDMEDAGICIDTDLMMKTDIGLTKRLKEIEIAIMSSPEVREWNKYEHKRFNPASPDQLQKLLFEILKYPVLKLTDTNRPSTDKEVLRKINTDFTNLLLEQSKIDKIQNTYIAQFKREVWNGVIHPSCALNTVSSYRSSFLSPSIQNIPKRDKESLNLIRSLVVPRKGNFLLGGDFKSIEVGVGCSYHHDRNMIRYCSDLSTDMHRDTAACLFIKDSKLVTKIERQAAKNGFVFPEFYGDWWAQCAVNIWEQIEESTKEHLKSKGIDGLGELLKDADGKIIGATGFYKHVKDIEFWLWNDRFPEYKAWRWKMWESYQECGYIELCTGFRCTDLMDRKQVANLQIQGTAFHMLLWCWIVLNKIFKRENLQTKAIMQIHDQLILDVYPPEFEHIKMLLKQIMTKDLRENFKFICVPMQVELEKSEIDGNWANMESLGYI